MRVRNRIMGAVLGAWCATAGAAQDLRAEMDRAMTLFQGAAYGEALEALDGVLDALPAPVDGALPDLGWQQVQLVRAITLQRLGRCGETLALLQGAYLPAFRLRRMELEATCQEALGNWLAAHTTWAALAGFAPGQTGVQPGQVAWYRLQQAYARARWSPIESVRLEVLERAAGALAETRGTAFDTTSTRFTAARIDALFGRTLRARTTLEAVLRDADATGERSLILSELVRIDARLSGWAAVGAGTAEVLALEDLAAPLAAEMRAYAALAALAAGDEAALARVTAALDEMQPFMAESITFLVRLLDIVSLMMGFVEDVNDKAAIGAEVGTFSPEVFAHDAMGLAALARVRAQGTLMLLDVHAARGGAGLIARAEALLEPVAPLGLTNPPLELSILQGRAEVALSRARGLADGAAAAPGLRSTRDKLVWMARLAGLDLARTPTQLGAAERAKRAAYRPVYEEAILALHDEIGEGAVFRGRARIYIPHEGDVEIVDPDGWRTQFGVSDHTRDQLDEAFRLAQSARLTEAGRAMVSTLARLALADDALGALLRERDRLLEERAPFDGASDPELIAARRAIDAQIAAVDAQLTEANPDFERMLRPVPLSIADTVRALPPGEAVMQVMVMDGDLVSLVVDAEGTAFYRVPLDAARLKRDVAELRLGLDPSAPARAAVPLDEAPVPGAGPRFRAEIAHRLYQMLLAPHAEQLDAVHTVHVVADGPLLSIPLSMLLRSWDGAPLAEYADYARLDWAIRHHAFGTLPVLSALGRDAARRSAETAFVGVGDPVLAGRLDPVLASAGGGIPLAEAVRALVPLPETRGELERLNALVAGGRGEVLVGNGAREPAVMASRLGTASIVAFATHGLLRGDLAGLSEPALVLTPPAVARAGDDGLLMASEIAGLDLVADWVLLSACNTAAEDGAGGEGLSGLARAFLYSGASRVLATHWPLQSDTAVALTNAQFEALAQDPSLNGAQALRAAILQVLDAPERASWAHPAAWAPFVVIGG